MATKRILVIDDEADLTLIVKHGLEQTGEYEVREVTDSTAALAAAREFQPDLIILDVMMPALDGGDVALCLSADPLLKRVPIIFLTATILKEEVEERGGRIGGHPFIAKPVDMDELLERVRESLADAEVTARQAAGRP